MGYLDRHFIKLTLGVEYDLRWKSDKKSIRHKLIQVTDKGFNFLNLETNKCILKRHLYPSKWKGLDLSKLKENEHYFSLNNALLVN